MINIESLTTEQLQNPGYAAAFFTSAQEFVDFPDRRTVKLAEKLAKLLDLDREREMDDLDRQYSRLVSHLRMAALSMYNENEAASIIQQRLLDALGLETIDVMRVIKAKLIDLQPVERDGFRQMLREAMMKNEQAVSTIPMQLANGPVVKNTVANWFKDYVGFTTTGGDPDMKRSQFFVSSKNFQVLPEPTKRKIRELFSLYEWLKLSSLTPEGTEETFTIVDKQGHLYDLDRGRLVRIDIGAARLAAHPAQPSVSAPPVQSRPVDPMKNLRQKYADYRVNRQRILELEDDILVKTRGESQNIYHELAAVVQSGDKLRAIACLKLLARQRALAQGLKTNPAWWEATAEYITQKYTGLFPAPEVKLAVSNLKFDPTTPTAISEFLQFVLKNRLKLPNAESALIGVEIGQLMGGEFQSIAYGNAETGEFEWVKNIIADRKLVSEM